MRMLWAVAWGIACTAEPGPMDTADSGPLPPRPPVATDDVASTTEDDPVEVDVRANDVDPDGGELTVVTVETPVAAGAVAVVAGRVRYVPGPDLQRLGAGEPADVSIRYVVRDVEGLQDEAILTVTVNGLQDAPVARDDAYTVTEGGSVALDRLDGVLANDSDIDGDALTASLVRGPAHGGGNLNPNGSFVYLHDGSELPTDSFVYAVTDGTDSGQATVTLTVTPVEDAPVVDLDGDDLAPGGDHGSHVLLAPGAAGALTGPRGGAVGDVDSALLTGLTARLASGTQAGDTLSLSGEHPGFTARFDGETLAVTGSASPESWTVVLDALRFTAGTEGTRAVAVAVTDGAATSAPAVATIDVAPPVE